MPTALARYGVWEQAHACGLLRDAASREVLASMRTIGPIEHFMTQDHERLDQLLAAARNADGTFDLERYAVFRHDLLRHIGMEEKVLFPYARAQRDGQPLPVAAQLHADHGRIAKLLVPTPTHDVVIELLTLLNQHNPLEEGPDALYALCDALAHDEAGAVVARLQAQPRVPLAKHYDGPTPVRR